MKNDWVYKIIPLTPVTARLLNRHTIVVTKGERSEIWIPWVSKSMAEAFGIKTKKVKKCKK